MTREMSRGLHVSFGGFSSVLRERDHPEYLDLYILSSRSRGKKVRNTSVLPGF
jgi:hypothetical protein